MSSISSRIGLIASFATAALIATPRDAAAWAPTTLDCDNLVPWFQSNNYGWWWGALGNCKTGVGGPTGFEAVFQCAWKQVEPQYQLSCVEKDLRGAPNTAAGVDVVTVYNGGRTCTSLSKLYTGDYAFWEKAILSAQIGAPNGLTNPIDIFNFAFRQLPVSDQQTCLRELFQLAPITASTIDRVAKFNTPGACPALITAYQANAYKVWWNALGTLKTGPGGLSTREEIIDAAFRTLDPRDQQPCLLEHLSAAAVTDAGVFVVRAYNGIPFSVATNTFTEPKSAPELCDLTPSSLADNYFASQVPFAFLEGGGPSAPSNFNVPAGQHLGSDEGRLSSDFRRVAQLADPIACALPLAAHTFAEAEAVGPGPAQDTLRATAQAYADLAVTGTKAFEKFRSWNPTPQNFCAAIEKRTQPTGCLAFVPATDDQLRTGCLTALSRAYRVANFLRVGQALRVEGNWFELGGQPTITATADQVRKGAERLALGWIAVSGEDDAPHRPVNVPSSDHPQYNIGVDVDAPAQNIGVELQRFPLPVPVRARYTIAQSNAPKPGPITYHPKSNPFVLDADPVPTIAKGSDVILFIHGMDSRGEEATDITRHLFGVMTTSETPKNLVVITVDLPSSGYTETLDYDRISGLYVIGYPQYAGFVATGLTPMLDFLETFVVRFVETLPAHLEVPASMKAVMGGSLGGSLTFRLGRRANTPWVRNVVTWSAASIWTGMGEGNSPISHEAVSRPWNWANNRNASDPDDLSPARLSRRRDFFSESWDQKISDVFVPLTQPETWTSDSYICKLEAIAASRMDRQETYSPKFLSWRWRLAAEQLLYSHQTFELETGQRRFMRNDKRMFLSCGTEDDVPTNEICDATQITADVMTLTPGMARYLPVTGHSVDAERPRYFARKMNEFLGLR